MTSPDRATEPPTGVISDLVGGSVASRIAAADPSLGPGRAWPGWVRAARTARPMVGAVSALGEALRVAGLHRIVLVTAAGVGVAVEGLGVGTAPGTGLVVLDTADPESVADVLAGDLDTTALVTVLPPDATAAEAESVALVREVITDALRAENLPVEQHCVLVCAPDGPLAGGDSGATLLVGPPDVSGLWSSLSAYTLVPAGLAGADIGVLLAGAGEAAAALALDEPDNPALVLGALLAAAPAVALTGTPALVEYATELVAGGLGKGGRGPLAVRLDDPDAPLADLVRSAGVPEGALAIEVAGPGGRHGRGAHAGHARRRRARAAHRGLGRRAGPALAARRRGGRAPARRRPDRAPRANRAANPPATAGPRSSRTSSRATSPCGAGAGCPRAPTRSSTRCARSSTRPRPRPPTWPCTPILTGRATPPPRCCGWSWPAAPG